LGEPIAAAAAVEMRMPPPGLPLGVVGVRPALPATAASVAVSVKVLVVRVRVVRVGMPGGIAVDMTEPVLDRLGAALQPTSALIATHRDEGRFDEGDRVVRVGLAIGP
jgi:hypothetical protein